VVLDKLLIHDFDSPTFTQYGVKANGATLFTLRDSIIMGGVVGVRTREAQSKGRVENCTVGGMSAFGVDESHGLLDVVNTISVVTHRADFRVTSGSSEANLSWDATGTPPLTGKDPVAEFFDGSIPGLRLKPESDARDAGVSFPLSTYRKDISGEPRVSCGRIDLGAHEASDYPGPP
jgi:hypothetical protein